MGILYKLTFPNGKIYIGMTTVSLRNRLYCHGFKAKAEAPKLLVHRAWKLHGEPLAEVLAIVDDADLPATEVRAIRAFGSFGDGGYNMTPGRKNTEETKAKMSESAKRRWARGRAKC